MAAESSQSLDRGLQLLALLAEDGRGVAVSDLASRLGTSRPTVYRMLASLERHNLVWRTPTGRVRLGLGILALAHAVTLVVREVAAPHLRALAEELGATAHLTVADPEGDGAVAAAVIEPTHTNLHVALRVGARHGLDRGAGGRAILLARQGGALPGGYVVSHGELEAGATGIAAPILGVAGLEASVGIVTIDQAVDPSVLGPKVVRTAAAVASALSSPKPEEAGHG